MSNVENVVKNKSSLIISIFAFVFLMMGIGATSPALADIAKAFPGVDFSVVLLVATLPSLFMLPSSLIAGKLAGTVLKFKTLMIISIVLFLVGGVAPYFISNFTLILAMRAIVGIASGIMVVVPTALVMNCFEGAQRENLMGINGLVGNIGGIIFQMVGGILCAINWRYTFLTYLLAIVSLVIVVSLMSEPPKAEKVSAEKIKMPGMVYFWAIITGFYFIILYPMLTGMSSLVVINNYGTAVGAGVALTMYTGGGMLAGAIFGKVIRTARRFTVPLGFVICAVGYLFLVFGTNLMLLTVGGTLVGIGGGFAFTAIMMYASMLVPPSAVPFAISILMAFMSIGGFVSGFIFAFIEHSFNITSLRFPFVVGVVVFLGYSVIHTLVNLKTPMAKETSVQQ